jgi:hypothetical protein
MYFNNYFGYILLIYLIHPTDIFLLVDTFCTESSHDSAVLCAAMALSPPASVIDVDRDSIGVGAGRILGAGQGGIDGQ